MLFIFASWPKLERKPFFFAARKLVPYPCTCFRRCQTWRYGRFYGTEHASIFLSSLCGPFSVESGMTLLLVVGDFFFFLIGPSRNSFSCFFSCLLASLCRTCFPSCQSWRCGRFYSTEHASIFLFIFLSAPFCSKAVCRNAFGCWCLFFASSPKPERSFCFAARDLVPYMFSLASQLTFWTFLWCEQQYSSSLLCVPFWFESGRRSLLVGNDFYACWPRPERFFFCCSRACAAHDLTNCLLVSKLALWTFLQWYERTWQLPLFLWVLICFESFITSPAACTALLFFWAQMDTIFCVFVLPANSFRASHVMSSCASTLALRIFNGTRAPHKKKILWVLLCSKRQHIAPIFWCNTRNKRLC